MKKLSDNLVEWLKCSIFARKLRMMTLEIKDGELNGYFEHLSFIVHGGELLHLKCRSEEGCRALLMAVMGIVPLDGGYVTLDGEEINERSAVYMRRFMGYVPRELRLPDGSDRHQSAEEQHAELLQTVASLHKPVVLVDSVCDETQLSLCRKMASDGSAVLIVSETEN